MLPAELALALLELLSQLPEPLGVVEDVGDAFLSCLGGVLAARLGVLSGFAGPDAAFVDAGPQLVDGQTGAGLSCGNGVEIGAKSVLVSEDSRASL